VHKVGGSIDRIDRPSGRSGEFVLPSANGFLANDGMIWVLGFDYGGNDLLTPATRRGRLVCGSNQAQLD
jgi:hypothetical protein